MCTAQVITLLLPLQVFNVAGTLFLVDMKVAESYPDTLLGSERIHQYYIPSRGEYFLGEPSLDYNLEVTQITKQFLSDWPLYSSRLCDMHHWS